MLASPLVAQTVTFTAQGLPDANNTLIPAQAQRAALQRFLELNPEIEIEPFAMPQMQSSEQDSGPLMAIAAGIPPHAIYVNFRQSSTYLEQGFLLPLEILLARVLSNDPAVREVDNNGRWAADPTAAEVASALEQIRQRVPKRAWEVVYRESETKNSPDAGHHVWAIPTDTLVMALWYRKDLFHAAGLDPERPPADWGELLDYSRRLTIPERGQYGLSIYGGPALSWGAYTFVVSNGARAVAQDDDGAWRAAYATREAAEAIYFLWRLVREPFERDAQTIVGSTKIGTNELPVMWQRGQIAMKFGYLNRELLGDINPQLVGIAPVPASPRGTRGSELNCMMMGVFSGASPAQQLAVMRYLWFTTSEDAQRIRTAVYVDNGYSMFVNPDLLEKFGYDRALRRVPEGWKQAFEVAIDHGVPEPYGRNTQNIYRYLTTPISLALEQDFDKVDQEDALAQIQSLLEASQAQTNRQLLGVVSPDQMRTRQLVAGVAVGLIVIVFIAGGVHLWRFFSQPTAVAADVGGRGRALQGWLMLAPALLLTVGWLYLPLAGGLAMSFTDYRLATESSFVGLNNFAEALFEPTFWSSLARTMYYVCLMIVLGFWPPILLAILLDEVPTAWAKYVFRTVYYLPAIISGVIIMFLWRQLYDPAPEGALNRLVLLLNELSPAIATLVKLVFSCFWLALMGLLAWLPMWMDEIAWRFKTLLWLSAGALAIGGAWAVFAGGFMPIGRFAISPLRWVDSPELAMLCVVLPTVWATAGPGCLLYLAALKTIPSDLYEAAEIDGASICHKVCYITLPRLKFLIGIQFIAAVVAAFKGGTDYILAMTGGGPNDATMILALQIFVRTFMDLQFGLGSAMAWLLGLLLVGITAYQLKMLSRAEFTADGKGT